MTDQNQSSQGSQGWDPHKPFNDAVNDEQLSDSADAATAPVAQEPIAGAGDPAGEPGSDYWQEHSEGDGSGQPGAPVFGQTPEPWPQPSAPQYGQSAAPYAQPYGDPYADPYADPYGLPYGQQSGYGTPAAYGAGQFGPGQLSPAWTQGPTQEGANTLTLNYWLSVFFSWIPALIFYLTEKDKNALVAEHVKENMNFTITRVIVGIFAAVPVIGWVVGGIASLVLFIIAIMGAIQGPDAYRNGQVYRFPLTLRLLK